MLDIDPRNGDLIPYRHETSHRHCIAGLCGRVLPPRRPACGMPCGTVCSDPRAITVSIDRQADGIRATGLENAPNMDRLLKEKLGISLTDAERDFLTKNQFVLLHLGAFKLATRYEKKDPDAEPDYRSTDDEMLNAFDSLSGGERNDTSWHPRLVTPDVFLHAFHRYFANSLEVIEQPQLAPVRGVPESAMRNAAELRPQRDAATAARMEWVEAQLATAWIVLGCEKKTPKTKPGRGRRTPADEATRTDNAPQMRPAPVTQRWRRPQAVFQTRAPKSRAEVALILAAKGIAPSPLYACYDPAKADRLQPVHPRSHYTKTEELRGWFRAMMFLGLRGPILNAENPRSIRRAGARPNPRPPTGERPAPAGPVGDR